MASNKLRLVTQLDQAPPRFFAPRPPKPPRPPEPPPTPPRRKAACAVVGLALVLLGLYVLERPKAPHGVTGALILLAGAVLCSAAVRLGRR